MPVASHPSMMGRTFLADSVKAAGYISILMAINVGCGGDDSPEPAPHDGEPKAQPPLQVSVSKVTPIGTLMQPETVLGRDGGMSGLFEGRSVWMFGDTVFRDLSSQSSAMISNSWSCTDDFDARDGIDFVHHVDGGRAPLPVLSFSPAEQRFNAQHASKNCAADPCGVALAIWPTALVADLTRDRALLFYGKLLSGPGVLEFSRVEHFIAVWDHWASPATRFTATGEEPSPMFRQGEPPFGNAAVTEGEALYVYGCELQGDAKPCRVARVPLASTFDRNAWRFYSGGGAWSSTSADAAALFEGNEILSVAHNAYLSAYLTVYAEPLTNRVLMRTAPRPEGPWSEPIEAFTTPQPARLWVYDAQAHPELEREAGRVQYVTYTLVTSEYTTEMRLVELELSRD